MRKRWCALRENGFLHLAGQHFDEGRWTDAMWAARLCVAPESEEAGEQLTDEIRGHKKVRRRLADVRRDPTAWAEVFGEPPRLSRWVRGDLDEPIFSVSGR